MLTNEEKEILNQGNSSTFERGSPNFDCMSIEELKLCKQAFLSDPEAAGKLMFPDENSRGQAVATLLWYVKYKIYAVEARLCGNITAALTEEASADSAYADLPNYAKW